MQLTLDDLRKSNDPLALLVGMRNRELDRIAAEAQGLEFKCLSQGRFARENDRRDWQLYMPSNDLNHTLDLMKVAIRSQDAEFTSRLTNGDTELSVQLGSGEVYKVTSNQANGLARAICVLAILGLVGKDGAA